MFLLCRGPLSAGSHSSRTSKAVIVSPNGIVLQFIQRVYIKDSHATIHPHGITKLLIEITIVNLNTMLFEEGGFSITLFCVSDHAIVYILYTYIRRTYLSIISNTDSSKAHEIRGGIHIKVSH